MILSVEDKQSLLSKFPSFKLCYENIAHNKVVPGGFNVAIPKGPKCFVWFSLHAGVPACILIERGRIRDTISDISIVPACFNPTIVGTILSGTITQSSAKRVIVLDDVYFYKNRHVGALMPIEKVRILGGLFVERNIANVIELKTQFMMAQMGTNVSSASSSGIYCIQQRKDNRTPYLNAPVKQGRKVFKVVAETQNDIYTLYDENDADCGLACIQTYETSKLMNSLFRNIKENRRLDALEESDDEDEFENISLDKFIIDKSRMIKMECEYVPQFKKWQPIKRVDE
jgi:hypothetical protein